MSNDDDQMDMFLGESAAKIASPRVQWSDHQKAIFDEMTNGRGNVAIIARAGCGKSTVTLEVAKRAAATGRRVTITSFARKLTDELREKARDFGLEKSVRTLHSLGFGLLKANDQHVQVDENKGWNIAVDVLASEYKIQGQHKVTNSLKRVVMLAKSNLLSSTDEVLDMIGDMEIDTADRLTDEQVAVAAVECMRRARLDVNFVDFDDQVWLPVVLGLRARTGSDDMLVDEAQDMNRCQLQLALRSVAPGGRVILVGDPKQAIFGFRGAGEHVYQEIAAHLAAKELPLPVSYRCARAVVREAQKYVPDIQAAPGAPEGVVREASLASLYKEIRPGDFVLSRNNASLVSACTGAIRAGVRSNIQGRDLGTLLSNMVRKADVGDVEELEVWIQTWRRKESEKKIKRGQDPQVVEDRAACLTAFCDGAKSVADVQRRISEMFDDTDDGTRVIFSTVHRAKGLERERVFLLRETFLRARPIRANGAIVDWQVPPEERNIFYVAITRAKRELVMVHGVGTAKED